jgi:urease accessory protein
MIVAGKVLPAGTWQGQAIDRIALDHDLRNRRRRVMKTAGGLSVLLDLPMTTVLQHGDGLELEDGRIVVVEAKAEELVEISAADPAVMVRVAWHLGNRHLPVQILGDRLRIRRDHVIEEMLLGLGAVMKPIAAPFDPEGGAYSGHGHHDHGH